MKKGIIIKEHIVHVECGDEFATFSRQPNEKNKQWILFSIPITSQYADILDKSGIVEVESYSTSGQIIFKRRNFYETHLMAELITDILEKYHDGRNNEWNVFPIL